MQDILQIAARFQTDAPPKNSIAFGYGHINDTYRITTEAGSRYILQRINTTVFREPEALMQNLAAVTAHMQNVIRREGGDPQRGTLNLVPLKTGALWLTENGDYWRMTLYIDHTVSVQIVSNAEEFYYAGRAFGTFTCQLADFPSATLLETIPDFHNTPARYRAFEEAVARDVCGRAAAVQEEIAFARANRHYTSLFTDMLAKNQLPLRVTHNDTKLNNVLLDEQTAQPVAVIDLDTVMPGLSLYDFGDSIRYGTNPAAEDEQDLSKVYCDLQYFESFANGYLQACGKTLTETELRMLPYAGKMMALECGLRFLTDHLNGDTYFKIHRENQNLDRCRTQFRLVRDMESKLENMQRILRGIIENL